MAARLTPMGRATADTIVPAFSRLWACSARSPVSFAGRPPARPRAFAAMTPALVRSRTMARSNSAIDPKMWKTSRPPAVPVSIASAAVTHDCKLLQLHAPLDQQLIFHVLPLHANWHAPTGRGTSMVVDGYYNPILVTLSYAIAVFGSYTALDLAGRARASRGGSAVAWLAGAAAAMGGTIWSMHFVGMLALIMPMPVAYDLDITLLSLALPILV